MKRVCHPEQVEALRGVEPRAEILSVARELNAAKDLRKPRDASRSFCEAANARLARFLNKALQAADI